MNLESMNITVVGAAIGGSPVALILARAGTHVTLIEKVATPRTVGAGIGIAENGMAVLQGLDLGDVLSALGRPVSVARIVNGRGRTLFTPAAPQPGVVMVRRSVLHEALHTAIAAEPRITTWFGAEVLSAAPDARCWSRITPVARRCSPTW